MLGTDGRLFDSDFDFDGDGKLNAYEYSVMDDVVFGHEDTETSEVDELEDDTYGYSMPRHRVIVFQEVLMHIASDGVNQIGFERALKQAGIEYQKNFLHYSKHDANLL